MVSKNSQSSTSIEELKKKELELKEKEEKLKKREEELIRLLSSASRLSINEAKKELLRLLDKELQEEKAKRIRAFQERLKLEAKEISKEILIDAMKHGATNYVAEYTVSSVIVPNEEVKGRVIGKGGKNIRAFERACGVELEIDETNEIRISSFDAVRREIARRALEKLIKDARIQPARIEEVVSQTRKEVDEIIIDSGKEIAQECGVFNLPFEVIKLLGRFKFRTSYGQNLALHTIEETKIGVAIANEIGARVDIVRMGCLLHDIGKVVTDQEGNHIQVGVNVLKRFGFPKEVINAVAEHHEDVPFSSVESVIVWIADAISGSRPGARYEAFEDYVKRMEDIEKIAKSFDGVKEAYAFQAGREVRVIVEPEKVSDDELTVLAYDISKRLEKETQYAGQIKVVVIREVRAVSLTSAK